MITVGSLVRLNVPDNPRLHGARAFVHQLTEWGAHVLTHAAETGQFRALFSEMAPYAQGNGAVPARDQGYTGSLCGQCGSARMRRNGACECCEDCGSSSGCS